MKIQWDELIHKTEKNYAVSAEVLINLCHHADVLYDSVIRLDCNMEDELKKFDNQMDDVEKIKKYFPNITDNGHILTNTDISLSIMKMCKHLTDIVEGEIYCDTDKKNSIT